MGIDARIYFKTRSGEAPDLYDLPAGVFIEPAADGRGVGATHEAVMGCRYWSPSYPRGPWPSIAAVLMALLAHHDVSRVWYDGDSNAPPKLAPKARLIDYCNHYMEGAR